MNGYLTKLQIGDTIIVPESMKISFENAVKEKTDELSSFIHFPRSPLDSFNVVFVPDKEALKWTGRYLSKKDRFVEYNTEKPSEWELYFGFVEKEMVFDIQIINTSNYRFWDGK